MIKSFKTREEWLSNRINCIGGSDASAVLGQNPYKSNAELFEEKVGLKQSKDLSDNPFVIYGTKAEILLIKLFALDFPQYKVKPNSNYEVYQHDTYPFIACTRDASLIEKATGKKGALEIKTTEILNSMHKEKWNDQVPQNYYIQILQYFATDNELEFVWLKAQLKSDFGAGNIKLTTKHYYFTREQCQKDVDYLIQKEVEFWKNYIEKRVRPSLVLPQI